MGIFYVNYSLLTVHLKNEMVKKKNAASLDTLQT